MQLHPETWNFTTTRAGLGCCELPDPVLSQSQSNNVQQPTTVRRFYLETEKQQPTNQSKFKAPRKRNQPKGDWRK